MAGGVDPDLMEVWRYEQEHTPVYVTVLKNRNVKTPHRHHLKENHDFMMEQYGHCVYCDNGSVIMTREEINREIEL